MIFLQTAGLDNQQREKSFFTLDLLKQLFDFRCLKPHEILELERFKLKTQHFFQLVILNQENISIGRPQKSRRN